MSSWIARMITPNLLSVDFVASSMTITNAGPVGTLLPPPPASRLTIAEKAPTESLLFKSTYKKRPLLLQPPQEGRQLPAKTGVGSLLLLFRS